MMMILRIFYHRLHNHPQHLDVASMAAFMHAFSETDKLAYHGTKADDGESCSLST